MTHLPDLVDQEAPATQSYREAMQNAGRNHVAAIEQARDHMHNMTRQPFRVWTQHQRAARRIYDAAVDAADQTYDAAVAAAQAVYDAAMHAQNGGHRDRA